MYLHLKDLAVVGEDHQMSVRRCDKQMLDKIFVLRLRTQTPFAAASLPRVGGDGRAFDVAGVGDGDGNVFVGDEIFDAEFDTGIDDDGSTSVGVHAADLGQFIDDHLTQNAFVLENILELGDVFDDLGVFVEDLLPLKRRQTTQLQIEDRLCLYLGEFKVRHDLIKLFEKLFFLFIASDAAPCGDLGRGRKISDQPLTGFVHATGISDQRNNVIERVDRLIQSFQDVSASLSLAKVKLRTTPDNLAAKLNERLDDLL